LGVFAIVYLQFVALLNDTCLDGSKHDIEQTAAVDAFEVQDGFGVIVT
jgi:hypothetical protein